jgi:alkyldihydroxyacetonephosphate synthase
VTPTGLWSSARLPASGAGPSPDRVLLGSEGVLGVITDAWVRLQARPAHRAGASVLFDDFASGAQAVRDIVQAGLDPAGCRLLDADEALLNGAGDGDVAVLVLGFESAVAPVDGQLAVAIDLCRAHGGRPAPSSAGNDPAGRWRDRFLQAPYLRDALIGLSAVVETFETAITWDRFGEFHGRVMEAARRAVADVCEAPTDGPGAPRISCRFTHVYPDGPAPYFTVLAPARRGGEVEQWDEIKAAVSEALISAGGTITHHHAVGRDHRPWYDLQRPEPFAEALAAAKRAVDPSGLLNPGVLIDLK